MFFFFSFLYFEEKQKKNIKKYEMLKLTKNNIHIKYTIK